MTYKRIYSFLNKPLSSVFGGKLNKTQNKIKSFGQDQNKQGIKPERCQLMGLHVKIQLYLVNHIY